jgi:hypothetical protein
MLSETGDWVGAGRHRFYLSGSDSVTVSGNTRFLTVSVSGGSLGDSFSLDFAAPPGESLRPGLYLNAERAVFRDAGRPGIDIGGDGRGCNTITGRFDVKDLQTTANGTIQRLWLTYEQHCDGGTPALFGEVRINAANPDGVIGVPRHVWWPDVLTRGAGATIPITFIATGESAATLERVELIGEGRGDFAVRADECTGLVLTARDGCQVFVRFVPVSGGPTSARLRVWLSTGATETIHLEGFAIAGRTRFVMDSDPGDGIGQGESYAYKGTTSAIRVTGDRNGIHGGIDGVDGSWWAFDFVPADNDILVNGGTYRATRYPFNGSGAGMDVIGESRGCNTLTGSFRVKSISTSLSGALRYVSLSFVQHCEGGPAALRGTLDWHVPTGDTAPPPPVSGLTAVRSTGGLGVALAWTNPTVSDYSHTVVRYLRATVAPGSPNGSRFGYAGRGTAVTIPARDTVPITAAVYVVDRAGNVSPPSIVSVPAE